MELTGTQRRDLCNALCAAFPTRIALTKMVSFQLNQDLSTIVSDNDSDADAAFELVRWFEARGQVNDLLTGACLENGSNPSLQVVAQELRRVVAPSALLVSSTVVQDAGARTVSTEPEGCSAIPTAQDCGTAP